MPDDYQVALRELAEDVEKIIDDVGRTTDEIYRLVENDRYARHWNFAEFHILKALEKLQKKGRAYCYIQKKNGETIRYWRRSKRYLKTQAGKTRERK